MKSNVAAIVVHHRSYGTIAEAVRSLLEQGIQPENLVLVDNSEEPSRRRELWDCLPEGIEIRFECNHGYGAAVNSGLDFLVKRGELPEFVLVATHETRPNAGTVSALLEALRHAPQAAVAGPTLISGKNKKFVWSAGGYLAPVTRIPSHFFHRQSLEDLGHAEMPEERVWLDGAFLLYRSEDLEKFRMSEDFFLYMEETDLHMRFRKAGRKVLWVPAAQVWQDSGGIPPYYLARNLRLLFRKHEGIVRRLTVIPYAVARRVVADVVRRGTFSTLAPSVRGLMAKLPADHESKFSSVTLVNPLGAALKHYSNEVESVLRESNIQVETASFLEPSASGKSSPNWILDYVRTLVRMGRGAGPRTGIRLLIVWPVLGYWDIVLVRLLGISNATLVMHDPHPLVKAVGYSRLAKTCASLFRAEIALLAHSQRALRVLRQEVPKIPSSLVPHPILKPKTSATNAGSAQPIVRVFGQYKPDRDLESLSAVGRALSGSAVLEVYGRRWPQIEGWRVVSEFIEEGRLAGLMAESSVIVIPYKNFFQSGIAIRALELGVPFVGPKASVLAEMVGPESCLLVDDGGTHLWVEAIRLASKDGQGEVEEAGARWRDMNVVAWRDWAQGSTLH